MIALSVVAPVAPLSEAQREAVKLAQRLSEIVNRRLSQFRDARGARGRVTHLTRATAALDLLLVVADANPQVKVLGLGGVAAQIEERNRQCVLDGDYARAGQRPLDRFDASEVARVIAPLLRAEAQKRGRGQQLH